MDMYNWSTLICHSFVLRLFVLPYLHISVVLYLVVVVYAQGQQLLRNQGEYRKRNFLSGGRRKPFKV